MTTGLAIRCIEGHFHQIAAKTRIKHAVFIYCRCILYLWKYNSRIQKKGGWAPVAHCKSQILLSAIWWHACICLSLLRLPFDPRHAQQRGENVHQQQPPGRPEETERHRAQSQTGRREHDSDVLQRTLKGRSKEEGVLYLTVICGETNTFMGENLHKAWMPSECLYFPFTYI